MLRGMSGKRKGRFDRGRRALQDRVFETLYGRGAAIYDRFTDWLFLGEWQRWQETALGSIPEAGLVVELGAGTGRFAERAASAERRWIALDTSHPMLKVATRRAFRASYVLADARAMPLAAGCADAVIATFPTSYILDPRAASEIRRVLRPDGYMVVVWSGELAPHRWRRRWRRRVLALFYGKTRQSVAPSSTTFGLDGAFERRETAHGWAELFVGRMHRPGD